MIEVLKQFAAPASARMIKDRLPKGIRPTKISTVVKYLDRLVKRGILRKMTLRIEGGTPCDPKPLDEECYVLTFKGRHGK